MTTIFITQGSPPAASPQTGICSRHEFTEKGGELIACPFCVNSRGIDADSFVPNARVGGATPMFEWLGDGARTVFRY